MIILKVACHTLFFNFKWNSKPMNLSIFFLPVPFYWEFLVYSVTLISNSIWSGLYVCLIKGFFFKSNFLTALLRTGYRDFSLYSLPMHMHGISHYQHPPQSGTFVTADEITLTHHNHPESIVYMRDHS